MWKAKETNLKSICPAQMFQLEALPLFLGQMHPNASSDIPGGITGPGTVHWSGEREKGDKERMSRSERAAQPACFRVCVLRAWADLPW